MIVYVAYAWEWPYLPIAVADSPGELASLLGIRRNLINFAISRLKRGDVKTSPYHRAEIEEEEMIHLEPCPFCGGAGGIVVKNPRHYGSSGAFVRCKCCHAQSGWSEITVDCKKYGEVTEESVERGKRRAAGAWNGRVGT